MKHPRLPLLPMICALLLCTSACADTQTRDRSDQATSTAVFDDALANAQEAGASDEQLAELREAGRVSEIPTETAREAARRAVSCMKDAGVDARYVERTLAHGVVLPGFEVVPPPGADVDAEAESCDEREFLFVSQVYQLQPTSVEAANQFVEQVAPVIRECLEKNGYETERGATGQELAAQASEALGDSDGGVDCLGEAGVEAW